MQNGNPDDNDALCGRADESVARTLIDSFTTDMRVATHRMVADEPADAGGNGLGPSPYDLLAAALAACTSMTLKMYAARKNLPMDSVTVRVKHGKLHAGDCADCESDAARIDEFRREIAIEGDLSDGERQRLLEIAEMCPVHRTLHSEIKIRTKLA